ncbi:hypothetical protein SZ55_3362 [Pseudomonas sp. FeS53a]|nr:hypothetical protein SZ55_3362 [Pseudomonas sp. FeS53a]
MLGSHACLSGSARARGPPAHVWIAACQWLSLRSWPRPGRT